MSRTSLSDDQVKLVRYNIAYVKRDEEEVLERGEVLVKENLTDEGFASWRIAAYFQRPPAERRRFENEDDKRYLRVCHEVLCRWPRESLHYEKRQLDELRGIREAIEASGSRPPALGPDEQAVLDALGERRGSASTGEINQETGLSRTRIRNALDTLIEAGRVRRTGAGFDTRYLLEK